MANFFSNFGSRFAEILRPPLPPRYENGWQARTPLDDTKQGSTNGMAAINRGVAVICGNLTCTPMLVRQGAKEVTEGPVYWCLKRTQPSHFEATFYDMIQCGNGWMKIERKDGLPYRLSHVQNHRMGAEITPNGDVKYRIDGVDINYDDYIHVMARNAFSAYVGEGIVEHNSESVGMLLATTSIFRQLQGNGSHAEGFLTTDSMLTKTQIAQLREAYDQQAANGKGNAGGLIILAGGLKPATMKKLPSALDQDIISSLQFTVEEASRMTGVPLSFLGVRDANSYNSAIEAGREFLRNTLRPLMFKVEGELSSKLGETIYFDTAELVLGFGSERADVLSKLIYSGVVTPNEARQTLGFGEIKGGDISGMPANSVPLPAWLDSGQTPTAPTAPNPAKDLALFRARKGI
jgi:HK97 family phage portal protein